LRIKKGLQIGGKKKKERGGESIQDRQEARWRPGGGKLLFQREEKRGRGYKSTALNMVWEGSGVTMNGRKEDKFVFSNKNVY